MQITPKTKSPAELRINALLQNMLASNGKTVRHEGQVYVIRASKFGRTVLAEAEPIKQSKPNAGYEGIDLFNGLNALARELRSLVERGLVS